MPELPEVETIVRALRMGGRGEPAILGRTISGVHVLWKRTVAAPGTSTFIKKLTGKTITDVCRRGKYAILHLGQGSLLFHLRMSGDLRVETQVDANNKKRPLLPHDRLLIDFLDEFRLVFNDTRKFGRVWFLENELEETGKLGCEPFEPTLTPVLFHRKLSEHKRFIKPLLLDQTFIAGLGNIYTDEALHLAKLHPLTHANSITEDQAQLLLRAIRKVLQEGIRRNGASIDWVYRGGSFQNHFRVYQRTGDACTQCGTKIERIVVGQRSSHFCPKCQELIDSN